MHSEDIQTTLTSHLSTTLPATESIAYQPFREENPPISMNVWRGSQIALLTPAAKLDRYSPDVLQQIVGALDRAWNFYAEFSGREPDVFREIDGLTTIAVVPETCGAGCAFLGATGIEIWEEPYFNDWLHDTVAEQNQYDQILFFELGRNFWFYGDQLGALPTNATNAFGIANRFLSMAAADVDGAPFNQSLDFDEWQVSVMDDTSQFYFADSILNWENTVLANRLPPNSQGGPESLLASLFGRVHEDFGTEVYGEMWQAIARASATNDAEVATDIVINSASAAAGIDYSFFLKGPDWRFEVGSRSDDVLEAPMLNAAQTAVVHGFGGNDNIRGTTRDDYLFGGADDDTLVGLAGDDTAVGGEGDDQIWGDEGNDQLFGGPGDDYLRGGAGDDILTGGEGVDIFAIAPHEGINIITDFEPNIDLIGLADGLSFGQLYRVQDGANTVIGTYAGEVLAVVRNTEASQFNESAFFGSAEDNERFGTGGNDTLRGDLEDPGGNDKLFGGGGDDLLLGGSGDDVLFGERGHDVLLGESGDDYLRGGTGDDILIGGEGVDIFAIAPHEGINVITDFETNTDLIGLADGLSFGQLYRVQDGANTVIGTYAGEVLAVVLNAEASQFSESAFLAV